MAVMAVGGFEGGRDQGQDCRGKEDVGGTSGEGDSGGGAQLGEGGEHALGGLEQWLVCRVI